MEDEWTKLGIEPGDDPTTNQDMVDSAAADHAAGTAPERDDISEDEIRRRNIAAGRGQDVYARAREAVSEATGAHYSQAGAIGAHEDEDAEVLEAHEAAGEEHSRAAEPDEGVERWRFEP